MRKSGAVPIRTPGRVNFLEGKPAGNSPVHVEDKLVHSSGPSGQKPRPSLGDFLEYLESIDTDTELLSLESDVPMALPTEQTPLPPINPDTHLDFTGDKPGQWITDRYGNRFFREFNTPPQRQEPPPTVPPDKGRPVPLQIQLALPLGLVMESVQLENGWLHIDAADLEDHAAAAYREAPGAADWRAESNLHQLGHAADWWNENGPEE